MQGDDNPDPTTAFQTTFWFVPKCTGDLPSPTPEELGPLNWGHHRLRPLSAASAKLDKTIASRRVIAKVRVMTGRKFGLRDSLREWSAKGRLSSDQSRLVAYCLPKPSQVTRNRKERHGVAGFAPVSKVTSPDTGSRSCRTPFLG